MCYNKNGMCDDTRVQLAESCKWCNQLMFATGRARAFVLPAGVIGNTVAFGVAIIGSSPVPEAMLR